MTLLTVTVMMMMEAKMKCDSSLWEVGSQQEKERLGCEGQINLKALAVMKAIIR